ncbi:Retrovirus-related Pol polyprotein from transposon 17.6 [Takifugu flavidus]|uniref:ribonuclease H n=1 Tax=Takifugu flavidus TaxID=433684 RepID=A0A5C6MVC9_9TELE|nr:Retrovirus-related Pol polyprotein from transposon 17.6 [Takifugu flavidus]
MDSPFSISPPENFSDFPSWPNWVRRFERFRVAAGLDQKVYKLAEHCNYGAMQEGMIRDRLVVGIRYQGLSESLQMDSELTLAKAVLKIRQHEEIKKQQPTVRDTGGPDHNEANVDMMKYKKKFQKHTKGAQGKGSRNHEKEQRGCGRCGKTPSHSLTNCAARDAECRKCHKKGHYAALCKTKPSSVHEIQEEEVETVFLGSVSAGGQSKTWQKTLILNGQQTTFKLDTGADVTAIPAKVYSKKQHGPLTTATKRLLGPGDNALQVKGKVKEELQRMVTLGVIAPIDEPTEWCAGIVVVLKPNGTIRICVDLTHLNDYVCRERLILPAVDETLAKLSGATLFSKRDATAGFWQVPLHPESVPLTTFITPFGRYCFHRLPFGISSAPEHFQKRLSQMPTGLEGTVCHADDILVFGTSREQHDHRLSKVLERLQQEGLTLNEDKCEFAVDRVKFLGHIVSAQGLEPDPSKIKAITDMPTPTDIAGVRRYLGMVNYVGKFSPRIAELSQPIRELLKADSDWAWGSMQQRAFEELRRELSSPTILAQYSPNRATKVAADASSFGLGGVLSQKHLSGEWRPVAFISRSMTEAECRYAQIEKEALALTWACERFQSYLIGMDFLIQTDHKPLISLLGSRALDDLPPRILRFRLQLLRFTYKLEHVPGKNLITADALSRAPIRAPPMPEEKQPEKDVGAYVNQVVEHLPASEGRLAQIRTAQDTDSVCNRLKNLVQNGWPDQRKALTPELQLYWQYRQDLLLADGLLMKAFVMEKLKAIFSRHGVAEVLVTDGGPQFVSAEFADFAREYEFQHVTSSPRYPQGNAEAERAVGTVKSLLRKGEDPHKALMAYRATPLAQGASPAQLLMGRNIRTPLPVSQENLDPRWPDLQAFREKNQEMKEKQASCFNKRHRAQQRQELRPGQRVWVKNTEQPGVITGPAQTPRSYNIELASGSLRRNRSHIRVIPETPTVTRSGRMIRRPVKMDL